MFLYPLMSFTYSNILTCLYIYLYMFKTHIHPYIQIVNIVFTNSRSHCCACASADGLNSAAWVKKSFKLQPSCFGTRWDSQRQKKYCFVIYWHFLSEMGQTKSRLRPLLHQNPTWTWQNVARGVFSSILLSVLLLCLVWRETPGKAALQ